MNAAGRFILYLKTTEKLFYELPIEVCSPLDVRLLIIKNCSQERLSKMYNRYQFKNSIEIPAILRNLEKKMFKLVLGKSCGCCRN